MPITRRSLLSGLTATIAAPALAQRKLRRFSMLLNTSASGPQAWFYLAQDRGYLAEEGLEIAFTPGAGPTPPHRACMPPASISATATSTR